MIRFNFYLYIFFSIIILELVIDSLSLIRLAQIYDTMEYTRFFSIIPIFFISLYLLAILLKIKLN